ncbi:MAG: hypothetical protein ACI92E_000963 [Oceanicoccus sp.]|jgi:hypothetical protein
MKIIATSFFLSLLMVQPAIASETLDVRKLMTAYEFQQAGLDTLSDTQLGVLNQWLISYTANEAPIIQKENKAVKKAVKASIESRLVGDFVGWTGKTKFVLENGQIWQQRNSDIWRSPTIKAPNVVVRKNILGFYVLNIDGLKRSIGVKRVQ